MLMNLYDGSSCPTCVPNGLWTMHIEYMSILYLYHVVAAHCIHVLIWRRNVEVYVDRAIQDRRLKKLNMSDILMNQIGKVPMAQVNA